MFQRLFGRGKKDGEEEVVAWKAKLNDTNVGEDFYYNKELKAWVHRGKEEEMRRKLGEKDAPPPTAAQMGVSKDAKPSAENQAAKEKEAEDPMAAFLRPPTRSIGRPKAGGKPLMMPPIPGAASTMPLIPGVPPRLPPNPLVSGSPAQTEKEGTDPLGEGVNPFGVSLKAPFGVEDSVDKSQDKVVTPEREVVEKPADACVAKTQHSTTEADPQTPPVGKPQESAVVNHPAVSPRPAADCLQPVASPRPVNSLQGYPQASVLSPRPAESPHSPRHLELSRPIDSVHPQPATSPRPVESVQAVARSMVSPQASPRPIAVDGSPSEQASPKHRDSATKLDGTEKEPTGMMPSTPIIAVTGQMGVVEQEKHGHTADRYNVVMGFSPLDTAPSGEHPPGMPVVPVLPVASPISVIEVPCASPVDVGLAPEPSPIDVVSEVGTTDLYVPGVPPLDLDFEDDEIIPTKLDYGLNTPMDLDGNMSANNSKVTNPVSKTTNELITPLDDELTLSALDDIEISPLDDDDAPRVRAEDIPDDELEAKVKELMANSSYRNSSMSTTSANLAKPTIMPNETGVNLIGLSEASNLAANMTGNPTVISATMGEPTKSYSSTNDPRMTTLNNDPLYCDRRAHDESPIVQKHRESRKRTMEIIAKYDAATKELDEIQKCRDPLLEEQQQTMQRLTKEFLAENSDNLETLDTSGDTLDEGPTHSEWSYEDDDPMQMVKSEDVFDLQRALRIACTKVGAQSQSILEMEFMIKAMRQNFSDKLQLMQEKLDQSSSRETELLDQLKLKSQELEDLRALRGQTAAEVMGADVVGADTAAENGSAENKETLSAKKMLDRKSLEKSLEKSMNDMHGSGSARKEKSDCKSGRKSENPTDSKQGSTEKQGSTDKEVSKEKSEASSTDKSDRYVRWIKRANLKSQGEFQRTFDLLHCYGEEKPIVRTVLKKWFRHFTRSSSNVIESKTLFRNMGGVDALWQTLLKGGYIYDPNETSTVSKDTSTDASGERMYHNEKSNQASKVSTDGKTQVSNNQKNQKPQSRQPCFRPYWNDPEITQLILDLFWTLSHVKEIACRFRHDASIQLLNLSRRHPTSVDINVSILGCLANLFCCAREWQGEFIGQGGAEHLMIVEELLGNAAYTEKVLKVLYILCLNRDQRKKIQIHGVQKLAQTNPTLQWSVWIIGMYQSL